MNKPKIPTDYDILNELSTFSSNQQQQQQQTNKTQTTNETKNINNQQQSNPQSSAAITTIINTPLVTAPLPPPPPPPSTITSIDASLTQETVKVLSSIHLDRFKNSSFQHQFNLLFNDIHFFKTAAVQGLLANTNLRCISWMVFLECIPFDRQLWLNAIDENRKIYERIKSDLTINPRLAQNLDTDHPLAQETNSDWNQYFENNELKALIAQDVARINPHSQYFTKDSTKYQLIELLFIYVKSTNIDYRQGMHEILTCIMHVLHEEYTNLSAYRDSNEFINVIADLTYLEHDTYTLFGAIMATIYDWFSSRAINSTSNTPLSNRKSSTLIENEPKLFKNVDDFENSIITKINYITNVLLRNNDSELYFHFKRNDISLAPFGIRWLRLLYLRELEYPKCLIIWDAIFAVDKNNFSLADYLFISLLMSLRERIINSDASNCMKLLMQQHHYLDCLDLLKRALYLKDPEIYSMPESMDDSYEYITNSLLLNKNYIMNNSEHDTNNNKTRKPQHHQHNNNNNIQHYHHHSHSAHSLANNNNNNYQQMYHNDKRYQEFDPVKINKRLNLDNTEPFYNNNSPPTLTNRRVVENEMKLFSVENMQHNKDLVMHMYINKITELQDENESLNGKLNDIQELCQMCSTKLTANICLLQEEAVKYGLANDDCVLLAIAGLKQVRDKLGFLLHDENQSTNSIDVKVERKSSKLSSNSTKNEQEEQDQQKQQQQQQQLDVSSNTNNDVNMDTIDVDKQQDTSFPMKDLQMALDETNIPK